MAVQLTPEMAEKLASQKVIWVATLRPAGRPHLAPIWYVWLQGKIYLSTDPKSVKAHNLRANPHVSLALEDGSHPLICEGAARPIPPPWPADLLAAFFEKYEWDLTKETQYIDLWEITPQKWLGW